MVTLIEIDDEKLDNKALYFKKKNAAKYEMIDEIKK